MGLHLTIENYINDKGIIVNEPKEGFAGFKIAKDGALTASNAVIYGTIWASDGKIGGLTLSQNAMYSTDHSSFNSTNDGVYISPEYIALGPGGNICFNKNGTGNIGDWNINSDAFYTGDGFNSATGKYFGTSGLSITDKFVVDSNGNFMFGGTNGIKYDGSKVTLGADISITWNQVSGTGNIATTDQIPTNISQLTNDKKYQTESDIVNKGYQTAGAVSKYVNSLDFVNKTQATQITKDTVNTTYVNALEVTAKYVYAENILGTTITGKTFSGCTGDFTGKITASSGEIGGVTILSDGLYAGGELTGDRGMVYHCGMSAASGKHTFWAGEDAFYVNVDGSMHCSNADISGTIYTVSGNSKVIMENGAIFVKSGDSQKAFFGLDSDGTSAYIQMYDNYSMTPPLEISKEGITCKKLICSTNNLKCYAIKGDRQNTPVISSTSEEYYTSVIQTNKDSVRIYGNCGDKNNQNKTTYIEIPGTSSDRRLKTNIYSTNVNNALQQILKINHRKFNWKSDNRHVDLGYIAQELEEINPHMVIAPIEKGDMYAVNTFYMTGLITKSIQEMYAELKKENQELKKEVNYLKFLYKTLSS